MNQRARSGILALLALIGTFVLLTVSATQLYAEVNFQVRPTATPTPTPCAPTRLSRADSTYTATSNSSPCITLQGHKSTKEVLMGGDSLSALDIAPACGAYSELIMAEDAEVFAFLPHPEVVLEHPHSHFDFLIAICHAIDPTVDPRTSYEFTLTSPEGLSTPLEHSVLGAPGVIATLPPGSPSGTYTVTIKTPTKLLSKNFRATVYDGPRIDIQNLTSGQYFGSTRYTSGTIDRDTSIVVHYRGFTPSETVEVALYTPYTPDLEQDFNLRYLPLKLVDLWQVEVDQQGSYTQEIDVSLLETDDYFLIAECPISDCEQSSNPQILFDPLDETPGFTAVWDGFVLLAPLYSKGGPIHIGDENISNWSILEGNCWAAEFSSSDKLIPQVVLRLELFGVESQNPVIVNDKPVTNLPIQSLRQGDARPNYWSETITIPIPTDSLVEGDNTLQICAGPAIPPDFSGDKDDFQLRNIQLTTTD